MLLAGKLNTDMSEELKKLFNKLNEALEAKIKALEERLTAQEATAPDNYIESYY
jgi:hypothetical protein